MASQETLQTWVEDIAARIEVAAYEGELLDFFADSAGVGYRETDAGNYKSALVYLTFQPTIKLDTATGDIFCHFYSERGETRLNGNARKAVDEFWGAIHDC